MNTKYLGTMMLPVVAGSLALVRRVSPVLMLVAASYVVFYWLTIGGLS